MLSVKAVISTYCFVESPSGLAQVLWLDLESTEDDDVEVWVEGARVACPVRWQGRLAAGATQRAEVAVIAPEGTGKADTIPIEAVARGRRG